jgi:hypothetical protein
LEPIWYGYHAALLGALGGGVFDHYFFNLDFQHSVTFFWLFVGLAMVASRLVRHQSGNTLEESPSTILQERTVSEIA